MGSPMSHYPEWGHGWLSEMTSCVALLKVAWCLYQEHGAQGTVKVIIIDIIVAVSGLTGHV